MAATYSRPFACSAVAPGCHGSEIRWTTSSVARSSTTMLFGPKSREICDR